MIISSFNHSFVGAQNDHLYNAASRALDDLANAAKLGGPQWRQMVAEMAEACLYIEPCPECGEKVAPHAAASLPGVIVFYFSCPNRPCPCIWCSPLVLGIEAGWDDDEQNER